MHNNTTKVRSFYSNEMQGVILPRSDKVLSHSEIDRKIQKVQHHIAHLNSRLSQRKTHRGKGFRTHRISLQDQISEAKARLNLLQTARAAIPLTREEKHKEEILEIARKAISIASSTLGIILVTQLGRTLPAKEEDIYSDEDIYE